MILLVNRKYATVAVPLCLMTGVLYRLDGIKKLKGMLPGFNSSGLHVSTHYVFSLADVSKLLCNLCQEHEKERDELHASWTQVGVRCKFVPLSLI
jgi:hypothetical protein